MFRGQRYFPKRREKALSVWNWVIKLALPHLCLVTLSILYCVIGASIFMRLERTDNLAISAMMKREINKTITDLTLDLYNFTRFGEYGSTNQSIWNAFGERSTDRFIGRIYGLHKSLDRSLHDNGSLEKWDFSRSFFFATTTLTSIGYGNQTPSSRSGKIFCIFYAILGLPLVVITVADIAKFLSHFILWSFTKYLMLKWRLRFWFHMWRFKQRQRRESLLLQRRHGLTSAAIIQLMSPKGKSDEEMAEFLWVNLVNAEFVEVPASLMFALIVSYVTLGGFYFQKVEDNWTFFEGFYFSLISILAIGFGDFTPKNERYIYWSLLYIVLGIVLTTTCIDIVGIDYINKLHFWGRQFNKVDPLQWLKDVQERRLRNMKKRAMDALFSTLTALHYMRLDPVLLNNMKSLLMENRNLDDQDLMTSLSNRTNLISLSSNRQDQAKPTKRGSISLAIVQSTSVQMEQTKIVPGPPRNFRAISISVHSVTLKWDPPVSGVSDEMYYSLSYRLRSMSDSSMRFRPHAEPFSIAHGLITSAGLQLPNVDDLDVQDWHDDLLDQDTPFRLAPRYLGIVGIDRIPGHITSFTVNGLKSFALYQFTLVAVNKFGRGRSVHTQEYTEPSTVPLNVRPAFISDTFARIVWDPPARNKLGPRHYTVHLTSDTNQSFQEWRRIETSSGDNSLDLIDLEPATTYVMCVSANHNRGLATFSRSLQFSTLISPLEKPDSDECSFNTPERRESTKISSLDQSDSLLLSLSPAHRLSVDTINRRSISVIMED